MRWYVHQWDTTTQPSEPGTATCSAITAAIKNNAVDDVFQPAGEIVRQVLCVAVNDDEPLPKPPNPVNLGRTANRKSQTLRPQDPKDLEFELDTNHLPGGFLQQNIRSSPL